MFVKLCGITNDVDALLAVAAGADAVGFNFVPSSPRFITVARAATIAAQLPPEILTVGVFRDEPPALVVAAVDEARLGAAQLHGQETAADTRWVRERVPLVIKVFAGGDPELANAASYGADIVMLDSTSPGSGQVFDWSLAELAPSGTLVLLAGGLRPDNVGDAIEKVRPWGVDVASGIESAPGVKDPVLVERFVRAAKATAQA